MKIVNKWENQYSKNLFELFCVGFVVFFVLAMFNAFFGFLTIAFLIVMTKLRLCDDNLKIRRLLIASLLQHARTKKEKEIIYEIWGTT